MPVNVYQCADHIHYDPQTHKCKRPSLGQMVADVALYTAEHSTAEVNLQWDVSLTLQVKRPLYIGKKSGPDANDLLTDMNESRGL